MDWQLLLVALLVVLALLYLGRQTLRTWRGKGGGCGSCKCPGSATASTSTTNADKLIPVEEVRLRRR